MCAAFFVGHFYVFNQTELNPILSLLDTVFVEGVECWIWEIMKLRCYKLAQMNQKHWDY